MKFTLAKEIDVPVYQFRNSQMSLWANIYVHRTGSKSGYLVICSDYGIWSHYWCAGGPDFLTFLADLNEEYLMEKLEPQATFFKDRMIENIKQGLTQDLLDGPIGQEIEELEQGDIKTSECAYIKLSECKKLIEHLGYEYDCIGHATGHSNQLERFIKEVWPDFVAAIKAEILLKEKADGSWLIARDGGPSHNSNIDIRKADDSVVRNQTATNDTISMLLTENLQWRPATSEKNIQ